MLKPVDKKKNPGLAKLPEKVRNKMGYAKKGKIVKAALGAIALGAAASQGLKKIMKKKSDASPAMSKKSPIKMLPVQELYQKATEQKKAKSGKMMKASMGKSVRGYGAARTSGMGLQDESLPPGKSLDYYKDLM